MNWIEDRDARTVGERLAWGQGYGAATEKILSTGHILPYDDMLLYRQRDLAARIDKAIVSARIEEVERALACAEGVARAELELRLKALRVVLRDGVAALDSDTQSKPVTEHLADRGIFVVKAPK